MHGEKIVGSVKLAHSLKVRKIVTVPVALFIVLVSLAVSYTNKKEFCIFYTKKPKLPYQYHKNYHIFSVWVFYYKK